MENNTSIADLIIKYREAALNEEEQRKLDAWLALSEENKEFFKYLTEGSYSTILNTIDLNAEREEVIRLSREMTKGEPSGRRMHWPSVAAAIIFVVLTGILGVVLYTKWSKEKDVANTTPVKEPPPLYAYTPGKSKAVLSLDNGYRIALDTVQDGPIAIVGNIEVIKLKNGQIEFTPSAGRTTKVADEQNSHITVHTPRGAQYQLTLSDGSKVWLNASSEFRFPANLKEQERNVILTGEAYFEVNKQQTTGDDANRSFTVNVNEVKVYVLGTKFNIMSYKEENVMKTTLKKGSVEITKGPVKKIITSREQLQIDNKGDFSVLKNVDFDEETAWKDKGVKLNDATLEQVLHQISRLYDIDILIDKETASVNHLNVDIPGNTPLPHALETVHLISDRKYIYEEGKVKFSK